MIVAAFLAGGLALALSGCDKHRGRSSSTSVPQTAAQGPLKEGSWPAGKVKTGVLLHDDGQRLWQVPLHGKPSVLWAHSRLDVGSIAASPAGGTLAYTVFARPKKARDPAFYLYLLRGDGSIRLIDLVRSYGSIDSPIFLRPLGQTNGAVRLYWIRSHDELQPGTDRLQKQVMVLNHGQPQAIRVPLRWNEAVDSISGYAGAAMFAISLFRNDNLPTRLEVLRAAGAPSLAFWSEFGHVADTDVFTGVAWVSPREYVVPVGHRAYRERFSLRLFRVGCEYFGSHLITQGQAIDWGYQETPWPLLPGPSGHVLVLLSREMARVATSGRSVGRNTWPKWVMVDARSGKMTPTDARWSNKGWWTFVQQPSAEGPPMSTRDAACNKYSWTYP